MELQERSKEDGKGKVNIPDLLNQLLATVASAARPSTRSWEKNFILIEVFYNVDVVLKYSDDVFCPGSL